MNQLMNTLLLIIATTSLNLAQAQDVGLPAPLDDRYCMTCHGAEGQGNVGIQAPRIAGMEPWYLKLQLEKVRAGIRGTHPEDEQGLAMQPMAANLTDTSIADIVGWVGTFDYVPAEITIEGDVTRGRTLYRSCESCHGARAEGNQAYGAPALAGQNDWYLITQLNNFKTAYRGSHPDDQAGAMMIPMANMLPNEQAVRHVVSYINTLGR